MVLVLVLILVLVLVMIVVLVHGPRITRKCCKPKQELGPGSGSGPGPAPGPESGPGPDPRLGPGSGPGTGKLGTRHALAQKRRGVDVCICNHGCANSPPQRLRIYKADVHAHDKQGFRDGRIQTDDMSSRASAGTSKINQKSIKNHLQIIQKSSKNQLKSIKYQPKIY